MPTTRYTVHNGRIVSENRNGIERDYVPDPLGSTVALLDSNQAKTDTFQYWPYGEERSRTGTTPTPFRFVGTQGYYRDSARRTYVRRRHLDTGKGRWLTSDPSGVTLSAYIYADNDPGSQIDPTGLAPAMPRFPFLPAQWPKGIPRLPSPWYGNWCGPTIGSPPPPVDALDRCCQAHDLCYAACVPPGNAGSPFDGTACTRACDIVLCACLSGPVCDGLAGADYFNCVLYRRAAIALFCRPRKARAGVPAVPPPPRPGPPGRRRPFYPLPIPRPRVCAPGATPLMLSLAGPAPPTEGPWQRVPRMGGQA
jgi:RHS repeat-associated protein